MIFLIEKNTKTYFFQSFSTFQVFHSNVLLKINVDDKDKL